MSVESAAIRAVTEFLAPATACEQRIVRCLHYPLTTEQLALSLQLVDGSGDSILRDVTWKHVESDAMMVGVSRGMLSL